MASSASINNGYASFLMSLGSFLSYPQSLVERSRIGQSFLQSCSRALEDREQNLCLFHKEDQRWAIPIREVQRDGSVFVKRIISSERLVAQLQCEPRRNPNDGSLDNCKEDPAYRAMFFIVASSFSPMELPLTILKRILTFFQVMPSFLEFLYVFGNPSGSNPELRFSGFRSEMTLTDPHEGLMLEPLGRSGQRYQICFDLKGLESRKPDPVDDIRGGKPWIIRHAALHHQFDVVKGTQLWLLGDQKEILCKLTGEHLNSKRKYPDKFSTFENSFKSSLEMLSIYCRWSALDWRWYVSWSEEKAHGSTNNFLNAQEGNRPFVDTSDLVNVQTQEESINAIIMALESNAEIIERLQGFYKRLVEERNFTADPDRRQACLNAVDKLLTQLDEIVYDIRSQISRAEVLSKFIKDRKDILIQHLQARTAARQEDSANKMSELAKQSALEAVAVRIIAVITLVFLPATFVATVFSTDMVKYQSDDNSLGGPEEKRSILAIQRFIEVTAPLMTCTFGIAWWWYKREQGRRLAEYERQKDDLESQDW